MRAVVMGGTSGIGLATAERLTEQGMTVTATGRGEERLAALEGRVADPRRLDGTDREAVAAFFGDFGSFEHLVLCFSPGSVGMGPIRDVSTADLEAAFRGKLFAYLHAIQHAQVTDSITLVSGASARSAMPGVVALAAVNGGIERIVPPLAAELAPVRVNVVAPGVVDTDWWAFLSDADRQAQFETLGGTVPAGRVGTPEDVAGAIAYLTGAGFVTGSILPVDGGLTVA